MPDPIASTFASRFRRPVPDPEASDIERPGGVLRFWSLLPVALAFALFGAVVWLAYQDTSLAPPIGEPPLIKAAADPYKLPPDETEETTFGAEEGTVGRLWSDADQADQPERLLPTPETPRSPPAMEEPATADATLERGSSPGATVTRSVRLPAAEAPAGAAAGDTTATAAAAPDPAQSAGAPPASEESLREAEAALDRLLAEVTAMSDDTDTPGATAAAPAAQTAMTPPPAAADPASDQPPTPPQQGPAEPASPPASTSTAAVPAAPATPPAPPERAASTSTAAVPAAPAPPPAPAERAASTSTAAAPAAAATPPAPPERAPAPLPEVRPAAATARAAPPPEPRAAPSQTAAATVAQTAARRPAIAPGGDFRIQLAAVRGEADAQRAWQLFMADLGPVLTDVEPIFERAETANGVFYRVQVGPFASQQAADNLCEQLKQRNASCFVIRR